MEICSIHSWSTQHKDPFYLFMCAYSNAANCMRVARISWILVNLAVNDRPMYGSVPLPFRGRLPADLHNCSPFPVRSCPPIQYAQFTIHFLHPSMENIWLPCIPKITSRPNQQTDCLFACEVRSIPFHSDPFDSTAFPHCNAPAARQLMSAAAVEKTSPLPFISIKNRRKIIEASPRSFG